MHSAFLLARGLLLLVVTTLLLTACGGGGSGGGDQTALGGSGLSVTGQCFSVIMNQGEPGANCSVQWSSIVTTHIVASVAPGATKPEKLHFNLTGLVSPIVLGVGVDADAPLGTYSTTLRVAAYAGPNLMDTVDVPVTVAVVQPPTISVSALTFNMVEGNALPAVQSVDVSRTIGNVEISSAHGNASWNSTQVLGGAVEISLNSNAFSNAPGTYTDTLNIWYNGGVASIPVTLNIVSAFMAPSAVTFDIDQSSTLSDKSQTITVDNHGADEFSWSASIDKDWIAVTPASGDTGASKELTLTLVQGQLDGFRGGSYTATLTLSTTKNNVSDFVIPVVLNYEKPAVEFVAPYEERSGSAAEVIIRGSGFYGLSNPAVSFGTNPATSFTVISDTEIRATHPALTEGNYSVTVEGDEGALSTYAALVVRDRVNYTAGSIVRSGSKRALFYNGERKTIYLVMTSGEVWRYVYDGSAWTTPNPTGVYDYAFGHYGLAQSPDGKAIYSLADPYALRLDTTTLARTETGTESSIIIPYDVAFANDGSALYTAAYSIRRFDLAQNISISLYTNGLDAAPYLAKASLDGRRVYFFSSNNSLRNAKYYDSSSGTLVTTSLSTTVTSLSVDRTGDNIVAGRSVYNATPTLRGTLPDATAASVISPDGSYAYTYEAMGATGLVRKFDLSAPSGGTFPELGGGTVLAATPGDNTSMDISADGATLFITGDSGIVIQPAP